MLKLIFFADHIFSSFSRGSLNTQTSENNFYALNRNICNRWTVVNLGRIRPFSENNSASPVLAINFFLMAISMNKNERFCHNTLW